MHEKSNFAWPFKLIWPVQSPAQKFFYFVFFEIGDSSALSRLGKGRTRRHERGAGCDGRGDVDTTSDVAADGEVVWSWRPDAGAKLAMMLRITLTTVAKKPGHRGDHV